ncbi:unnamed protein product [Heligmosomoides polygyrus]|uniref:Uncharacterized protein n=1 Tax=Heligmosomoides polygyrus TaxID=6339 RepID=A0A183F6E7_HELPZ|nr:unnamed protein product [Heligmosomoides polygyrus]
MDRSTKKKLSCLKGSSRIQNPENVDAVPEVPAQEERMKFVRDAYGPELRVSRRSGMHYSESCRRINDGDERYDIIRQDGVYPMYGVLSRRTAMQVSAQEALEDDGRGLKGLWQFFGEQRNQQDIGPHQCGPE